MKKLNVFLFFGLVSLSAVEETKSELSFDSGMPLPKEYSSSIISRSTRDDSNWNFTIQANFNEYQATADSMEVGYRSSSDSTNPEGSIVVLDFEYHPGFQVGFILDTPYDNWDFGGGYFWFRGNSHVLAKPQQGASYVSPVLVGPFNTLLNSMNAEWDLDIDLIDVYMSRSYYSGKKMSINPFLGLKSGWIRQNFNLSATLFAAPSNIQTAKTDSRAWMIGPELGFQGNYFIGSGFSLFSNLATSFLYNRYNSLNLNYQNHLDETSFLQNNGMSTFRGIMDAGLGINWGSNGKYRVNLNAAYNLSVFFSQNMERTLVALAGAKHIAPGNLYLSGLSVGASFVF